MKSIEQVNKKYNIQKIMSIFKDKTLLITGGTGSFGNAILRRFLNSDIIRKYVFFQGMKKSKMICVISYKMKK